MLLLESRIHKYIPLLEAASDMVAFTYAERVYVLPETK